MKGCLAALFLLLLQTPSAVVTPLPMNGSAFTHAFNDADEHPRLVGIYSPSCGHCLQACADLQELVARHPTSPIRLFVLWAPFQEGDNIGRATTAAQTYLTDARAVHFWDLWKFGARSYAERFRLVPENTWGIVMFFEPGIRWDAKVPNPAFWMQSRNLLVGTPFSRKGLERRIRLWLETGPTPETR